MKTFTQWLAECGFDTGSIAMFVRPVGAVMQRKMVGVVSDDQPKKRKKKKKKKS